MWEIVVLADGQYKKFKPSSESYNQATKMAKLVQ